MIVGPGWTFSATGVLNVLQCRGLNPNLFVGFGICQEFGSNGAFVLVVLAASSSERSLIGFGFVGGFLHVHVSIRSEFSE